MSLDLLLVGSVVASMLDTKCVGDKYKMLVTVLAILVTHIYYLFTLESGTNIQKMSPTSKNHLQLQVTNITFNGSVVELRLTCMLRISDNDHQYASRAQNLIFLDSFRLNCLMLFPKDNF